MKKIINKISLFFKLLYEKLVKINDTPQKIALGIGLGVFSGIFPGTGPLAALFLSFIFRANRLAALVGSLLTNTWLSFVVVIPAVKLGSLIFKIQWQELHRDWVVFLKGFHLFALFKLSFLKIVLPAIAGFLIVAFCLGLLVYLITLIIILKVRAKRAI